MGEFVFGIAAYSTNYLNRMHVLPTVPSPTITSLIETTYLDICLLKL